jgi:hypothetical protein
MVANISKNSALLPRNRMRANANPTKLDDSTVPATTNVVTTMLLANASKKPFQRTDPICESASGKLFHCGSLEINFERSPLTVAACARSGESKLTSTIHKSGKTIIAVPQTSATNERVRVSPPPTAPARAESKFIFVTPWFLLIDAGPRSEQVCGCHAV